MQDDREGQVDHVGGDYPSEVRPLVADLNVVLRENRELLSISNRTVLGIKFPRLRLLYPRFDPRQGTLGPGLRSEQGNPLGGQLYDAKIWKAEGEAKLVMMVESYGLEEGKRPEYGAAGYTVDLALVEKTPQAIQAAGRTRLGDNNPTPDRHAASRSEEGE